MEKLKQLKEEEERKIAEKRHQKEVEWDKRELVNKEPARWLHWPEYVYKINPAIYEFSVGCVIRAQSNNFNPNSLQCDVVKQLQNTFKYERQEELVSFIIQITPSDAFVYANELLFIAIPHFTSRPSAITREVFIKMKKGACWCEVPTTEVIVDSHKDIKFAQTLLKAPAQYAVVTRLKRDYITFTTMPAKVVSSYDQRISFSIERNSFSQNEHLLLSAQPVDSASLAELRSHKNSFKGLLSCSPIILTEWESTEFQKPILVTLPCPPNPAKVKRLAAIRAQREERAKNPKRAMLEDAGREKKKRQKESNGGSNTGRASRQEGSTSEEPSLTHVNDKRPNQRWYMGIYASNDDDENDQLYFVACCGSKVWTVVKEIAMSQIKLDLLQMELSRPYTKFMVLRTRVTVDEEQAAKMAMKIERHLGERLVQVIAKQ
ncbi:uncharacterized protein LOC115227399, partial [Octopus sinensis]|uniref:Uncharacterized protein LOC115227399 n=1 Tax=Octopus sinensis TaxID=2607531 RepID=A0A6P7TPI1_9MOLL